MDKVEIRKILENADESALKKFDDINDGTVLGASNHIRMIADMFMAVAKSYDEPKAKEYIVNIGDFYKETRGKSSYAIITAIEKIDDCIKSSAGHDYKDKVENGVKDYFVKSNEDTAKILKYTDRLLADKENVMIFDYSSTVEKAVAKCSKKLNVYIPESRTINGGYPFVKGIVEAGHKVYFIPDACMLTVLDKIDIAFIGAETFYPDGTAFNTAGSDILAELCKIYHVPYYVLTPLLKADPRACFGIYKKPLIKDLGYKLAEDWPSELKEKVDFNALELVAVRPELITGYVSEIGITDPAGLFPYVYKEGAEC